VPTLAEVGGATGAARFAGLAAFTAGLAQLALFLAGGVGLGERPLIAAWNLLLIPVALVLLTWLGPRSPFVMATATIVGVVSLVLWAASALWPGLGLPELAWIGASAAWWLAIGLVLRTERRLLGLLTVALGIAGIGDFLVTVPELGGSPLPLPVFMLVGGWKIPLAIVWCLAVGASLAVSPPRIEVASRLRRRVARVETIGPADANG
jgi:hypothetical protein